MRRSQTPSLSNGYCHLSEKLFPIRDRLFRDVNEIPNSMFILGFCKLAEGFAKCDPDLRN